MRENKGFTLIELLAVIVILAIIALIATPVILGIIDDSRASANERSAELIKSGVQNAYTSYMMAHNGSEPTYISDFINKKYYTVDSTAIQSACDKENEEGDDSITCEIKTIGGGQTVTCTVRKLNSNSVRVDCNGSFSNGKKTAWYDFTAKVSE